MRHRPRNTAARRARLCDHLRRTRREARRRRPAQAGDLPSCRGAARELRDLEAFDAIVAFSAFHWLASDLRYTKTADLLRAHGKLAFVSTAHVLPPDGDPFFIEVQADYDAVIRDDAKRKAGTDCAFYSPPWRLPHPDALGDHSDEVVANELETSGRFHSVGARRYLWDVIYTADDYIALLNTYSHHRALDDRAREGLLERIHKRIEARPERHVRKTYLAMLYVAERVSVG
jgi:hypothetical protein